MNINRTRLLAFVLIAGSGSLPGCAGAIIETTADAALAVAKVPFKAGSAIIDVIDGDDD